MYSRNNRRSQSAPYGMTDEEYELYKYSIPPKYDGSRFRRHVIPDIAVEDKSDAKDESTETFTEIIEPIPTENTEDSIVKTEKPPESIVSGIFEKLGSEELLIISLVLAVAGGEESGELILILILLLLGS